MELIYTVIKFLTIYSISAENFIFLNKYILRTILADFVDTTIDL